MVSENIDCLVNVIFGQFTNDVTITRIVAREGFLKGVFLMEHQIETFPIELYNP